MAAPNLILGTSEEGVVALLNTGTVGVPGPLAQRDDYLLGDGGEARVKRRQAFSLWAISQAMAPPTWRLQGG